VGATRRRRRRAGRSRNGNRPNAPPVWNSTIRRAAAPRLPGPGDRRPSMACRCRRIEEHQPILAAPTPPDRGRAPPRSTSAYPGPTNPPCDRDLLLADLRDRGPPPRLGADRGDRAAEVRGVVAHREPERHGRPRSRARRAAEARSRARRSPRPDPARTPKTSGFPRTSLGKLGQAVPHVARTYQAPERLEPPSRDDVRPPSRPAQLAGDALPSLAPPRPGAYSSGRRRTGLGARESVEEDVPLRRGRVRGVRDAQEHDRREAALAAANAARGHVVRLERRRQVTSASAPCASASATRSSSCAPCAGELEPGDGRRACRGARCRARARAARDSSGVGSRASGTPRHEVQVGSAHLGVGLQGPTVAPRPPSVGNAVPTARRAMPRRAQNPR